MTQASHRRVILITGASGGIGRAAARRLASEPGAHVILLARRRERLEALAAEITAAGGSASVIAADLTDPAVPAKVAAQVEQAWGRLDLLVNNAGVGGRGRFADIGFAGVERTMQLNFEAPVRLTEALLPLLRRSAPSAVVNVASVSGRVGRPGTSAYSASKFALIGWSESLALEERSHGVHIGLVVPGFVATEGFPQRELLARRATRWMVSSTGKVAEAIAEVGLARKPERYAPRPWALVPVLKLLLPGLYRRAVGGGRFTASAKG